MSNLPSNTTYGTTPTQPSIASLSSLTKQIQQNAQKSSSSVVNGAIDTHFNAGDYASLFGTGKAPRVPTAPSNYTFPTGMPVTEAIKAPGSAPTPFKQTEALPTGYSQYVPADTSGNWVDPTSAVLARNLPLSMGGGQYIIDPTQPGKMIKSSRSIMDTKLNPGVKQQILGNLSPALNQVDHIVPLWVGGADTLANLEIIDNRTHEAKTRAQTVPLTLLANGKITLNEAKVMALNYKDKDLNGIPTQKELDLSGGYMDVKQAEKIAQQWKDAISKPVGIFDKRTFKYLGESFKENMDQFGEGWLPDPIREFGKGLVGGGTAGIVPGTGASSDSTTIDKISNVAGNVLGMMTGIGLMTKGLGIAAKTTVSAFNKLIGGASNAKKAVTITEGAMKTAGLATKKPLIDAGVETAGSIAWKKQIQTIFQGAGTLGVWGQIGQTGRQLTGQEEVALDGHIKQFFNDAIFGGVTAGYGQSIKGYLGLGLSTVTLSLILGGNRENNIQEALKQGAMMTGLHLLGAKGKFKTDGEFFAVNQGLKQTASDQVFKMSSARMNSVVPELVPAIMKGQTVQSKISYDIPTIENFRQKFISENPNDPSISTSPIQTQEDAVQLITRVAINRYGKMVSEARSSGRDFTPEQIDAELLGFGTAGNQLYNRTLDPVEQNYGVTTDPNAKLSTREQKEMKDMQSLVEKMKSKTPSGSYGVDYTDILSKVPLKSSGIKTVPEIDVSQLPTGLHPITGNSKEISKSNSDNIALYDKGVKNEQHSDQLYFVLDPKSERISRVINFAEISQGREAPIERPEDTIRAFYIVETPQGRQLREVGYSATKERIDKDNFAFNKNYTGMTNRIRNLRMTSKTPEEFYKKLIKDPSKPILTKEEATELFKEDLRQIDDATLITRIKATNALDKYNSNLNNSAISNAMRENGISVLPVSKSKLTKSNTSGEYFIATDIKPENWAEAIQLRGEKVYPQITDTKRMISGPSTPSIQSTGVSEAINTKMQEVPTTEPIPKIEKPIMNEQEQVNILKSITPRLKNVINKEPIVENAPKTSKIAQGVSKAIETVKTSPIEEIDTQKALDVVEKAPKRADPGQFKQIRAGRKGINEVSGETREKMTELAKEMSGGEATNEGIKIGWPKFLETFEKKTREFKGDETYKMTNREDLRNLKNLYTKLARSETRDMISIEGDEINIQKGSVENLGKIDSLTRDFNKTNGFDKDSMSVLHVDENNIYKDNETYKKPSTDNFDDLIVKAKAKGYVPIGITGKGIENSVFVKIEPKMVERFNKNPSKYSNEGETLTTEDKFLRTYMVDVLGIPKDIKDGDFVKRANLIYHRYDKPITDMKVNLRVLPAQTIKDIPEFNINKSNFESPESDATAKSVESISSGKLQDGNAIVGEKVWDELIHSLGYDPKRYQGSIKLIIDTVGPNGEKVYHKIQATKVDEAIRKSYKESHNIDIEPTDIISFDSNAKIGPKSGDMKINLSDVYAKDRSTSESTGKESPSMERKFLSSDPDITEQKMIKVNTEVKEIQSLIDDVFKTKNNTELKEVFKKALEKYPKLDEEKLFQGTKQVSFSLGAAKNSLNTELNTVLKNLVTENIINPEFKNSTMVSITAPIKADYDGTGKLRYVNDKEIILGEEQIKKLGVKEGDEVVVYRDPSYDINNVVVLKVVNGTKTGNTSLAQENGMISPYNERTVLQGDQDGDTMHVTKIGEGGMTQAEVNAIKARGNLSTPFTEVNPSKKEFVTNKSIQKVIKNQLVGDDQTSSISMATRIMDEVIDNKITVKVYGERNKRKVSKYEIYSNGKLVDTGVTYNSEISFTAFPKWGLKERQLMSQAQREAVDSKKSDDIFKITQNDKKWATRQLWEIDTGNDVSAALKLNISDAYRSDGRKSIDLTSGPLNGALNKIQNIYNIKNLAADTNIKSITQLMEGKKGIPKIAEEGVKKMDSLKPTIDYYKRLKNQGTKPTPLQEKTLAFSGLRSKELNVDQQWIMHKEGAKAVKKVFEKEYDPQNPKLKEIIDLAKKARQTYQDPKNKWNRESTKIENNKKSKIRKQTREDVNNFFINKLENGEYSEKDLKDISYWASSGNPDANIALGFASPNVSFTKPEKHYLYRDMIDASPEIAKVFYEGSETYNPYPEIISKSAQNVADIVQKGKDDSNIPPSIPIETTSLGSATLKNKVKNVSSTGGDPLNIYENYPIGKKIKFFNKEGIIDEGKIHTYTQDKDGKLNGFQINGENIPYDKLVTPSTGKGDPDGQGGLMNDIGTGVSNAWGGFKEKFLPGLTTTYKQQVPTSYDVRGIKVNDTDINEAADILYGEISNRPGKTTFETHNAVNTAINRALQDPKRYQGSLTKVLQAPYQYQSYSPTGATSTGGKVIETQYQKLKAGKIDREKSQKYKDIVTALNELKSGKFADTTEGKTFYVHASDGSMWLGKTQKEAKDAANAREKQLKLKKSNWGITMGQPKF